MNYQQADAKLQGRNRNSRRLCYSCVLERRENDVLVVKMHTTDILTFYKDGRVVAATGGWRTVTTKARLNDFISYGRIWSERGIWYWRSGKKVYKFADHMTINSVGVPSGVEESKLHIRRWRRQELAKLDPFNRWVAVTREKNL